MKHITITEIGNNLYKLVPFDGYLLIYITTKQTYSDAVVHKNKIRYFDTVEK